MLIYFERNANNALRPAIPDPATAPAFNHWRFNIAMAATANIGAGQEDMFDCPSCQRTLPTAIAQADHLFPEWIFRTILANINRANWNRFAGHAQQTNNNDQLNGNPLGQSFLALPDYMTLEIANLNQGWDIRQALDHVRAGNNFPGNTNVTNLANVAPVQNQNGEWGYNLNNVFYSYFEIARRDATNFTMLCAPCNQAKGAWIYPAQDGFVRRINNDRNLPNTGNYNILGNNQGVTYLDHFYQP